MRIAIVHDYLLRLGGAERVLKSIHEIFPEAPIYTLLYDDKMKRYLPNADIRPSRLNNLPAMLKKNYKFLFPIFPIIVENFNLRDYDLVISSSSAFAKGIVPRLKTKHICYIHAPMRFAWDWTNEYFSGIKNNFLKIPAKLFIHYVRLWDFISADRVDYFLANSLNTARKIKKYYKKESVVIYPPVRQIKSIPNNNLKFKGYFLTVSQIRPHKGINILLEAFNKSGYPLIIIGDGTDRGKLQKMAGKNIKFTGFIADNEVDGYLQNCKAFIFPADDDFGIAPLEAMSLGKPVLAYRGGGALETVIEGKTGEFFNELTPESLLDGFAVMEKNLEKYDPIQIKDHAEKFSEKRFKEQFKEFINNVANN